MRQGLVLLLHRIEVLAVRQRIGETVIGGAQQFVEILLRGAQIVCQFAEERALRAGDVRDQRLTVAVQRGAHRVVLRVGRQLRAVLLVRQPHGRCQLVGGRERRFALTGR